MSEQSSSRATPSTEPLAAQHVVILGLMGVGKTTAGRALAVALGWPYSDSDSEIERLVGLSGAEVADDLGVATLHRLEAAVAIGALARPAPHVIAAAASVVEDELVRRALVERAHVVRLVASIETILGRQLTGDHRRAMTAEELAALAERREPWFEEVEDRRVRADLPTDVLVTEIVAGLPSMSGAG